MKTAKQYTHEEGSATKNIMRTYTLFMLSLAFMASIILNSCATTIPHQLQADFTVTYLHGEQIISSSKQHIQFSWTYSSLTYSDSSHQITIPKLYFIGHNMAEGKDLNGILWTVTVGNMRHEPYFLVMRSDSLTIVAGYKKFEF